jgi:hypothetical protein
MTKHEEQALNKAKITDKIIDQIVAIRDTGETNMFDVITVQRIANDNKFYELVIFIEEYKDKYCKFIGTGNRELILSNLCE